MWSLNERLIIFRFEGLKSILIKFDYLPFKSMKFWEPPMTLRSSTFIKITFNQGDPHATARYLPSSERSISKISRGQTFLIWKSRDESGKKK